MASVKKKWSGDRVALADDEYEGIPIPKGMVVVPYIYGIHHSPALYEDPEAFRPERMMVKNKQQRHPYAYIPFGGGPRLCIGLNFAMFEMQLALIHLLRHFDFELTNTRPVVAQPYLTLRPKEAVMMRVKERGVR